MYFAPSSLWSDPDTNTTASPPSSSLELFPKLGGADGEGSGSGPTVLNDPKNDLNYLKAMLGDNPPTPGSLFSDFGISSLNLVEKKSKNSSFAPTSILEASAEGELKKQETRLKVTAPSFSPGTFETNNTHIRRNRSLSLSAADSWSSLSFTPLRSREHTSEAGSPTIEQVLLMNKSSQPRTSEASSADLGYGSLMTDYSSPSEGGLYSSLLASTAEEDSLESLATNTAKLSFADIDIDSAVDDAYQNFLRLKQKQVAIHSMFGLGNNTSSNKSSLDHESSYISSSLTPTSSLASAFKPLVIGDQDTVGFQQGTNPQDLEKAARLYRSAASHCEASCTWSDVAGSLPQRASSAAPGSSYSTKIFLGGVPWDISEQTLIQAFSEFGDVRVEWPGRDYTSPPKGYLYLVFEEEGDIKELLAKCSQDLSNRDAYYYKISSRRMRSKEVQIIPWVLSDSNFVRSQSHRLNPSTTVFVGALHGMMTAQALAVVFNDLFGGVIYAGLDTDKYKYPIGSGRVTFNNVASYMRAVAAAFIEIKTSRFSKKVQVDPYLEDTLCSVCGMKQGPYFCRDKSCFNYFCHGCWELAHKGLRPVHKPLMRNIRGITRARANNHQDFNNNFNRHRVQEQSINRNLSDYFGQAFGLN